MKEQEKLKSTVLKLYSAGSKIADIVTQTDVPRSAEMRRCWQAQQEEPTKKAGLSTYPQA